MTHLCFHMSRAKTAPTDRDIWRLLLHAQHHLLQTSWHVLTFCLSFLNPCLSFLNSRSGLSHMFSSISRYFTMFILPFSIFSYLFTSFFLLRNFFWRFIKLMNCFHVMVEKLWKVEIFDGFGSFQTFGFSHFGFFRLAESPEGCRRIPNHNGCHTSAATGHPTFSNVLSSSNVHSKLLL